jgi:hypothetical protein
MDTQSDLRLERPRAGASFFRINRAFSDRADTRALSSVSYHYSVAYTPGAGRFRYLGRVQGSRGQRFAGE